MKNSDTLSEFYLPLRVGLLALCASPLHPLLLLPPPSLLLLTLRLSLSPPPFSYSHLHRFALILTPMSRLIRQARSAREIALARFHRARARLLEFLSGFHAATHHITTSRRAAETAADPPSLARITTSSPNSPARPPPSSFFVLFVGGLIQFRFPIPVFITAR